MTFSETSVETLVEMLTFRRPAGTKTERKFIGRYIWPLGVQMDDAGNLYKRIGNAPVLWSCHTDTVHNMGGIQHVATRNGFVFLNDRHSNCLGSDDGAGVWLMREMILAQVPGLYIFHREEECGGRGSDHIATKTPELIAGIQHAIAFDRVGYSDVITHQGFGRCCSDDFALVLAAKLNDGRERAGPYKPCDGGIFTDTANYTELIPECTNVSVGNFSQHTTKEELDVEFLVELRDTLLDIDVSDLPIVRDPKDHEYKYHYKYSGRFAWEDEIDRLVHSQTSTYTQRTMSDVVADHPKEVADILISYGISYNDLLEELMARNALKTF